MTTARIECSEALRSLHFCLGSRPRSSPEWKIKSCWFGICIFGDRFGII